MTDESQAPVPRAFWLLHVPPGRSRPTEGAAHVAARHELCEDLAQLLVEQARTRLFELGVAEEDVLGRMHAGLLGGDTVSAPEAGWVIGRLSELLGWPLPPGIEPPRER